MARALVIGSQTEGLRGSNLDAERMEAFLRGRGLAVDRRCDGAATREGILDGYRRLIRDAEADEPVVVYYSGHGTRVEDPTYRPPPGAEGTSRYLQSIVPFDHAESRGDDYRGILGQELSLWQARLAERTRNITVILDCCHAALMCRGESALPKALPHPFRVGIAGCLEALAREHGAYMAALQARSESNVVRLVAARAEQSAFEVTGRDGQRCGLFTEALLIAFDEIGERPTSFRRVEERARELVQEQLPAQRPGVEGPADRRIFDLSPLPPEPPWRPIRRRDGALVLPFGRAHGIHVGDEFALMPAGADEVDARACVARATVTSVAATESQLALERAAEVPDTARAFQTGWAAPRRLVAVEAGGAERAAIVAALAPLPQVRIAEQGDERQGLLASVCVRDGSLELRNRHGQLVVEPAPPEPAALARLADNVVQMAHAQGIRELSGEDVTGVADGAFTVEWGLVRDGRPVPLPRAGATVGPGDACFLRLHNGSTRSLYVSVLDIGLADAVTLLSLPESSGIHLGPGQDEVLDRDPVTGGVQAMSEFFWPDHVPRDGLRSEEFVVLATAEPCDLSSLQSAGVRGKGHGRRFLQQLLEQSRFGGTRDARRARPGVDGFIVERIAFDASPWPVERGEATFLVDDRRPLGDVVALARDRSPTPRELAIRLCDVVVHSNRAVFRAEVRVDVLVITRSRPDAHTPYRAETLRFPKIADGDRLPLDDVLVYHGPVEDFVDVCVWVSRDRSDALSLADMLRAEANSPAVRAALGGLLAVTAAAPQAGIIVAAVGAAATLATIAYRLIAKAVGDSIGLYRTSMLARERFNVGRHPPSGLMRAQEFSFGYEVVDVSDD